MPPNSKFTKEEIVNVGIEILRKYGMDAVTARSIGAELKSSPRPIFTVFNSMDEVLCEIEKKAKTIYSEYVLEGLKNDIPFKGVGQAYIKFAITEPKLFALLFMTEQNENTNINHILRVVEDNYSLILSSITDNYNVSVETATKIYKHLWIYSHGIAAMCATGLCKFTAEEINSSISEIFISLLKEVQKND